MEEKGDSSGTVEEKGTIVWQWKKKGTVEENRTVVGQWNKKRQ